MTDLQALLIADWILQESAAEQIIRKTPEGYVFYGEKSEWYIEVKAFRKG